MKVIELCLSHGVGGLELYALRTAVQLPRFGITCLAVVRDGTMLAERMQAEGVRTRSLKRRSKILPLLAARQLAAIIDQEAVDAVHIHWSKDINLAVLAKQYAKREVKLIHTRQMMITRPKKDIYHRYLYNRIDLYLAITRQLRDIARVCLPMPEQRIQLLYYGVDQPAPPSAEQRRVIRQEMGVSPSKAIAIGLVGRIEKNKGQHLLIDALHLLRTRGFHTHVTFIGPVMDNTYLSHIQSQVSRLGLQKDITFFGSHANPIDIMSVFDIAVLATEEETFGLVLIEAMRNGVAVVGSNAGGVPEIIEDGVSGLLFQPGSALDLATQLERLCRDDGLRHQLGAAGKARADARFALETHYQSLKKHFDSVVRA